MAINQTAYVDLLVKKLYGVDKTDLPGNKSPSNEAIASPLLNRGDRTWTQATSIPTTAAAVSNIVQAYTTTSLVECTGDTTTTPVSSVYPTWKTGLTNWIPPEFDTVNGTNTYRVAVYYAATGAAASFPTGFTQIYADGSGGTGEYYFDYQAGTLNFIGGTIPTGMTGSSRVYVVGYRYIGLTGVTNLPNITLGTGGAAGTLTTNGAYNLLLNTNAGTNSGTITITQGVNGNIAFAPNGSGLSTFSGHLTVEGVTSTGATGTGKFVFDGSPTLVTPTLGVASATSINKVAFTAPATGSTLTIADGKTLTASNTLTFTGTDSSSVAFGTGGTVAYTSNKLSVFAATSSSELAGVISDETGTGSLVFGTSPTFTTSILTPVVTTTGATSLTLNTNSSGTGASITVQSGTNSNVNLAPSGTGTVDVGSARITNLATPTQSTDAATKAYVDATASGLDVKQSVRMATTANLSATASGTGLGKTLTNSGTQAVFAVDGITAVVGDRVLVKNQTTTANNGVYTVTTVGTVSTNWVLTRATDADNSTPATEVTSGMFTFIEEGSTLANTGWVLSTTGTITLDTTGLTFSQFSGAGTYLASGGLQLVGNTFSVNLGSNSSLTTTGNTLQVNSTIAGNGLTYTNGVIDVVGTSNRISVTADAIDISSSYVGQATITTLGTISTGVWNGTVIGYAYGGTGQSTYAKGDIVYASAVNTLSKLAAATDGQVLQLVNGAPAWGDLDGGTYV